MTERITGEEARRLRAAATPGPWWLAERAPDGTVQYVCAGERYPKSRIGHIITQADSGYSAKASWDQRHRDLALIAAAPDLAAEVERLTAQLDEAVRLLRAEHLGLIDGEEANYAKDCTSCKFLRAAALNKEETGADRG